MHFHELTLICHSIGVPQGVLEGPVKFSKQLQAEASPPTWILAILELESTNLEQEENRRSQEAKGNLSQKERLSVEGN